MTRFLYAVLAASVVALYAAGPLKIPFKEYKLDNGLRVILSEDHTAPTYSLAITYDVGSRDEKEGRTGFAHLFEHMMFQGSENVGKGEHFILIDNNGGNMNGTTTEDRTNYFETLPANQLDLGLFLESDRMRALAVTQGNLDNQRNAVQEEKRMRGDNQPYGDTFDTDSSTAFDNFAYKHSVIGSMKDLDAATLQDVQAFFKRYYAPNNAVLTLVGDFQSADALAKIRKYFGAIPAQPAPPRPDVSEPEQKGERRKTIQDKFAQVPRIDISYKAPPSNEQDFVALDVLGDILSTGDSSRLYQKLVKEKQQALQIMESSNGHRGPGLIMFIALVRPGVDPTEIEKSLSAEIERVKTEGVTNQELEKIRMRDTRESVAGLQSSMSRAIELGQYAVYYNDPNMINTVIEKVQKVTKEDIQRVARQYLVDAHKTVVITMPEEQKMKTRTILVLLLPCALLLAQQDNDKSVSLSQVERKNKAPVSKEILKVKLPKPVEAKLDNGLTVLILENHKLPYIAMNLLIEGAGPINEPAGKAGLAAATASQLTQGTATRSSRQIAEEVDLDGASLHASSGFGSNDADLSISGLSQTFDKWFGLFTDVLLHPAYPEAELKNYRQRALIGLKQQRAQSSFLASERFNRAVYGVFPASVVSASPEFLQAMTPADLQKWHDEHYVPQNAILGITGDVNPQETLAMLKKSLAAWKRTDSGKALPPSPPVVEQKHVYLVNRPGSVQTNITIGNIAIDRRSPDYIAMRVMNQVLGGSGSARLFLKLREEKGYTYGAYSTFTPLGFAGPWRAFADVRTDVTDGSMTEFFNELNRIRTDKVPVAELEDAKRAIVATFALSLESPSQLLQLAITQKRYGLPADYWDTYPEKVAAVTADDVLRTAKKYINPGNAQVVAVGDAGKIKAIMEKYGPVTVYDTNGKEISN